ncbi:MULTISPECIES: sensor domain-containing diguanylate cyclase [Thiomicrorhabdus]|uniref:Diguanylate cyclase n=1 Tax=Thiomicrorhabdus heinhorstiae TaxID=2748010 RepID=A0ABS0BW91_9GAMM|nr:MULTISPECIES: sensor domain-containing diguanylate cyclase [Thiomicrorhabdus]MBF6058093.1 diguanylate cyclase [Thiomicrorhabdus heinhorstiae]
MNDLKSDKQSQQEMVSTDLKERRKSETTIDAKRFMSLLGERFSHSEDLPKDLDSQVSGQIERHAQELFQLAFFDSLTQLPNRLFFDRTLERLVTQNQNSPFVLLFLDLNGFKPINDTYGHLCGDNLLAEVGKRLASAVRDEDIVSRYGGDEFVVLLTGLSDREVIERVCQRILKSVSRDFIYQNRSLRVSTSIGIARFPHNGRSAQDLIEQSDKALYFCKGKRKGYCFVEELMPEKAEECCKPQSSCLAEGMKQRRLKLLFSPQVGAASQNVLSLRADLSCPDEAYEGSYFKTWKDCSQDDPVAPSLMLWWWESVLAWMENRPQDDLPTISFPVIDALLNDPLCDAMTKAWQASKVPAGTIRLAVSAKSKLLASEKAIGILKRWREQGFELELDDVGESGIDLNLLSQLSFKVLQLDAEWARNAVDQPQGQTILSAMAQFAALTGAVLAVDQVDSEQEKQLYLQAGIQQLQGHLWQNLCNCE